MSQAFVIVRNQEVVAAAATYDQAVTEAKREAEYAPDPAYIYQQVARAVSAVQVTVTAPVVQVKR